jgi:hypothetical protein
MRFFSLISSMPPPPANTFVHARWPHVARPGRLFASALTGTTAIVGSGIWPASVWIGKGQRQERAASSASDWSSKPSSITGTVSHHFSCSNARVLPGLTPGSSHCYCVIYHAAPPSLYGDPPIPSITTSLYHDRQVHGRHSFRSVTCTTCNTYSLFTRQLRASLGGTDNSMLYSDNARGVGTGNPCQAVQLLPNSCLSCYYSTSMSPSSVLTPALPPTGLRGAFLPRRRAFTFPAMHAPRFTQTQVTYPVCPSSSPTSYSAAQGHCFLR